MSATELSGPRRRGRPPFVVGLIALVVILVAIYFAYSGADPFASPYRFTALFRDVNDLKPRMPVRVAGVNVGEVTVVEPYEGDGDEGGEDERLVRVELELGDDAPEVRENAELAVRTRIFLEGNYFVQLDPGTDSAPALEHGGTLGTVQHASPVQFGEVLTALQSDTREDLRNFLDEYSTALDEGGAEGFNEAIKHWEGAYRGSAIASDASQGRRPGDLRGVIRGQARIFGALARDEQALRDLVVNLNRTAAAFAREGDSLRATIPQLRDVLAVGRPALQSLNAGLPSLRAFARDALPAARSSKPALDAQLPFVRQARQLVSRAELRGLAGQLRRTVPDLVRLNLGQTRSLEQSRALASCQNNVLLKFSRTPIEHPYFDELDGESFFEQSPRSLVGLAGESRLSDANSPFFRVQAGGGPTTVLSTGEFGEELFAQLDFPLQGLAPLRPARQPSFRPDIPCETQEPPNLEPVTAGPSAAGEEVEPSPAGGDGARATDRIRTQLNQLSDHLERVERGLPSVDPLVHGTGRRAADEARSLGLELTPEGGIEEADR